MCRSSQVEASADFSGQSWTPADRFINPWMEQRRKGSNFLIDLEPSEYNRSYLLTFTRIQT